MRITVIGAGYVGLITGVCLADSGNDVVCHDIDEKRIKALQAGRSPIYEPGLQDLLETNADAGRIRFTSNGREASEHGRVIFLTVGTPPRPDGSADTSFVEEAARQTAMHVQEPKILAVKSTVPVGTGDRVQEIVAKVSSHPVAVVSNPEFLKEGSALEDFLRPDRVIIGTSDRVAGEVLRRLYAPFVRNGKPILMLSRRGAEISKYAGNAYLAMRISFINEVAGICEKLDVDVDEVRAGIGSDSRIGHHFLYPGPGYGGSCFPKDVQALACVAKDSGARADLLETTHKVNQNQQRVLFEKVVQRFGTDLSGRTFAIWGVTFKAKTDDIRESPALRLIDLLLEARAEVVAHDPQGLASLRQRYGSRIGYETDTYAVLRGADALIIVTEWNRFRSPGFSRIRDLMKTPVVIDGRNLYDPEQMQAEGFEYYSIGRRARAPVDAEGQR
jgi:UDPglucose 6-dehydrogenase